ncbi:MAG: nucleoside kinase [Clostridiales bacterium]|nr:nucleoside kinase [Clostridiales bacterium]
MNKENIIVTYDKETKCQASLGISLCELLKELPARRIQPVAAVVNGKLQELDYRLYIDSRIEWLDHHSSGGHRVYKRSLVFLLLAAATEMFGEHQLWVSHSLENGLFCRLKGVPPLDAPEIDLLQRRMRELVQADLPITRNQVTREDGASFFLSRGKADKARLLLRRNSNDLNLYTFDTGKISLTEYFFGRLAISTGMLNDFSLMPFEDGFILCLPGRSFMGKNEREFSDPRRIQATLNEYGAWVNLLGISTVTDLNRVIENGDFSELVLIAETLQERMLHRIADNIVAEYPKVRLVLIAGPSSSGKTTFTRRLGIQLRTLGITPIAISMDDYFHDRDKTPLNEDGKPDFEGTASMDMELFNRQLAELVDGEEVLLPRYDFYRGERAAEGRLCRLGDRQIIIVEGIHALNEAITASISHENKRKIFVSALTQLNLDPYNPIATSDNRLIRRMVRDMKFRSMSPAATLERWEEVRRGEHSNIFPFQEEADYYFNSSLIYELPVLRPYVEAELAAITPDMPAYLEAKRLLRFIQYFGEAQSDIIPKNSILQEFLGGSCFET